MKHARWFAGIFRYLYDLTVVSNDVQENISFGINAKSGNNIKL